MSALFSFLSIVCMVSVVVFYFKQVYDSRSTPNPATWLVWIVVMAMNTATYYFVTGGKLLSIGTPLVITIGMVVIMVFAWKVGRVGKLGFVDWLCFTLAIIIGIFWQVSKNSLASNLLMQIVLTVSYIPTIVGLLENRLKEKALAWNMAVASYFFLILSILSGERWTVAELVYPTVNGLIGNGSVPLILWWKKRKGEVR